MTNRRLLYSLCAIAAVTLIGGVAHYRSDVAYRAHRYFSIPWTQRVTPTSIRDGVLRLVPLGTPADRIPTMLDRVGIGKDGLSGYYKVTSEEAVIRLEFDPRRFALVQTHYGIMLHFDGGMLRNVRVEKWLTGL